ncbi:MAG TPA: hypothetical protein VK083_00535 [Nocardia sp.]|uniref:hypothetical protein n=1 Tax=Nocardia TaxID=1817 RepID=UPI002458967F|nr:MULTISPECIES: hypothetical protein [Nocardia]HLS75260.1 hypothetical protein [Nocardia sp.]
MNHQMRSPAPAFVPSSETVRAARAAGGAAGSGRGEVCPEEYRGIVTPFGAACADGGLGAAGRGLPRRERRGAGRDVQRVRRVDRRPLVGRPAGTPVRYERVRVAPRRSAHRPASSTPVERAEVGFAALAVAALVTALFVIAMLLLTQWRAGVPEPLPSSGGGLTGAAEIERVSSLR